MHRAVQSSSTCVRRLLAEYRNVVVTAAGTHRFKRVTREKIRMRDQNSYLGTPTQTIKVTKTPSGSYYETKLSDADIDLIGRNDFMGVRTLDEKGYQKIAPENAFSQIKEQLGVNRRVNAEFFMVNILIQLESKNEQLVEALLRKPDFYVPIIVRCCGSVMTDLHRSKRTKLLDRLVAAFKLNDVPLSLSSINAILSSKLENDCDFNVKSVLEEVEQKRRLTPDIHFFNCLFWQSAKNGMIGDFKKLRGLCVERGIQPDKQTDLAEIYHIERRGISIKSDALVKRFEARYGDEAKFEALGAACCGAAKGDYIDRLRVLLRLSVLNDIESDRYVLKIPQNAIFDVIWSLAENSVDGMGKQWATFAQQRLFSEAERHINHRYFYSGIVLFEDMYRIRYNFEDQGKTRFASQMFGRLANRMVSSNLESNTIIELANRVVAFLGIEFRFYDNILLAILTYKHSTPMEKFDQFRTIVDMVDPNRERIHIILPLVTNCPDLVSRYKMLFRCSNIGYKNIADLNPYVIVFKIVKPFMDESTHRFGRDSDYEYLQSLANALKSYGIPLKDIWLLYFNLLKEQKLKGLAIGVADTNMANWLDTNKDLCFPRADTLMESRLAAMDYAMLKRLVLEEKNAEKVHEFLTRREFPPDTDFHEIAEPLLYLYIETANWGYLQKLLQLLSYHSFKLDNSIFDSNGLEPVHHFVKNYHLLHVLRRKLDELPPKVDLTTSDMKKSDVANLVEYVYELKRLFPSAVADQDTFFETIAAYRRLFSAILQSQINTQISTEYVEQTIEMLMALVRLDIINLHANETLTPFIVFKVMVGIGWIGAVEAWMKFQVSFNCSNGVLELFRHAIRLNDAHKIAFVAHKAKTFISSSRVDALLAAAHVLQGNQKDAENVLASADPQISSVDVTSIFRLTNALLSSRQRISLFPLNFLKICLEHSNLRSDEKALQLCHRDWIRLCERVNQGSFASEFIELFKSYGIELEETELNSVKKIVNSQQKLISKWITGPNGLLNLDGLNTETAEKRLADFRTIITCE